MFVIMFPELGGSKVAPINVTVKICKSWVSSPAVAIILKSKTPLLARSLVSTVKVLESESKENIAESKAASF